jgi:KUP system potassium uptake protein
VKQDTREPTGRYLATLSLAALGIVYGDIGTSPLYAVRECFHGPHAFAVTEANVLGVLSLIFWSLIVVISVKYLLYVMRADNDGEGGILALMALALDPSRPVSRQWLVFVLGLFGAALLYGDGAITPAISVLSAVEGLEVAAPALEAWVMPIAIGILATLFWFQHKGTAGIGLAFGPITVVWFAVLAALGVYQIVQKPGVFAAVSPAYAIAFFMHHGLAGVIVLGAVFLVVTGGEALYADMGHFGARPIRLAWFSVVLPALLINYFGQGAMILRDPSTASAPLFRMAPDWGLYPLIMLATAATIIASQAVISGTYSITGQAIMLGYAPRMTIEHTSSREIGQIYMPTVNWGLLVVVLLLVVGFGSSSNLAAAYGIAVTSTMLITTILAYVVARRVWGWSRWLAIPLTAIFLLIDLAFFGANSLKIPAGGWFPLALAAAVFVLMSTWKRGREILAARLHERAIAWNALPAFLEQERPARPAGTGVYMTSSLDRVPPALLDNVRHNHALHDRVVLLSIELTQTARVSVKDRLVVEQAPGGFLRIRGRYGFTEHPDVPSLLKLAIGEGIDINVDDATFVLGRETILATERSGMAIWREAIFAFMSRNAGRAAAYFGIPSDQVLEIGSQIEL